MWRKIWPKSSLNPGHFVYLAMGLGDNTVEGGPMCLVPILSILPD